MIRKEDLTGVVLAGGRNLRFETNQPAEKSEENSVIRHTASILEPFCEDIIISGDIADSETLPYTCMKDLVTDIGPMGGIYTALTYSRTPWTLFLTYNMPLLTHEIIRFMLDKTNGVDAVLWSHTDIKGVFPLLLSSRIEEKAEDAIHKKEYRIRRLLPSRKTTCLIIPDEWLFQFTHTKNRASVIAE